MSTSSTPLSLWLYYLGDLPLFSLGFGRERILRRAATVFKDETIATGDGFRTLCDYLGRLYTDQDVTEAVAKTIFVRTVRESDAYSCLFMSKQRFNRYFRVDGLAHLESAIQQNRPILILSGHYGSVYTAKIALSHLGLAVSPIARVVDYSPLTPLPSSIHQDLNYRFTQLRYAGSYIFTDFAGHISRRVFDLVRDNGILWAAIDMPRRLYPHKHLPVRMFGQQATLPAGLINWAVRKGVTFITAWNNVIEDGPRIIRHLIIDPPLPSGSDTREVMNIYAERLSQAVAAQPWQWLPLSVIRQFMEPR